MKNGDTVLINSYKFKRITLSDVVEERFYKIPKFLFADPFKSLSNDAKIAYALLRDRNELSIKNKWINERGEVYLLYTRLELQEMLNVSKNTCTKIMKDLNEAKLITEEKLGDRRPNMIYINTIQMDSNPDKSNDSQKSGFAYPKNRESSSSNNGTRESQNMGCNNTNDYLTDFSDTNLSIYDLNDGSMDEITPSPEKYTFYELAALLDMDYLNNKSYEDPQSQFIINLMNIILDEFNKPTNVVFLSKENKVNKAQFEKRILSLKQANFDYVFETFNKQKSSIKNIRSYLLTMIYNSKDTLDAYYTNRVKSELGFS